MLTGFVCEGKPSSFSLQTTAWTFSSLFPPPNSFYPFSENMYPNEPDPPLDTQFQETQMDFFHKLGYSTAQVQAIQQQYGPNVDTDKVLGELVRIRASRDASQGPLTTVSVLVPGRNAQAKGPTQLLPCTRSSPQSREEGGEDEEDLRPIVIDGSNVAMSHGNKEVFSCLGIQLAVDFFLDRGHTDITVFVPSWRKEQPRPDVPISDQHILRDLEKKKILVFTPSRRVAGKRVVCNDDWFIVKLAYESDGIMVSNDMYRDLQGKEPEWKRFIEQRLLMYSFVNNKFMPPDDPLGRHGPTLDNFLRRVPKNLKKQRCPYGKKCTYGVKCKFHHRQQSKQSNYAVADELRENAKHPCIDLKQSSFHSVPGQSLFLVEDMAKKLNLRHESGPLKKDHKHESLGQVKTGQSSNKKGSPRKEKSGQYSSSDLALMRRNDSQEHLDSGLGSFDSLPMEAPWSDHQYGHAHSIRRHYGPPRSAPCSDCSSPHSAPAFQHRNQQFSHGPVSSHSSGMTPYGSAHYTSYGAYPVSMHDYNQHADYQHSRTHISQQYWSDPFGIPPPGVCRRTPEHSSWEPPCGTQQSPSWDKEREVVRKKLLGIFSASLVDRAMDMFPHLMDPQLLVAEILTLQSRNTSLR